MRGAKPLEQAKLREQLDFYPRSPSDVMPTKLGNGLKGAESYGNDQYGLDVVLLWTRITAVTSDGLRDQLNQARAVMDFFVGAFWLAAVFAVAAGFSAVYGHHAAQWVYAPIALALMPVAYRRAVQATTWYREAVRAVVDLTRADLAQAFGMHVPPTIEREREFWKALSDSIGWGPYWGQSRTWTAVLDANRRTTKQKAADATK